MELIIFKTQLKRYSDKFRGEISSDDSRPKRRVVTIDTPFHPRTGVLGVPEGKCSLGRGSVLQVEYYREQPERRRPSLVTGTSFVFFYFPSPSSDSSTHLIP